MSNPTIANNKPARVVLEKDKKYYFCRCGRSAKQPFCDGSHSSTSFEPQKLTIEEKRKVALCNCKRTEKSPLCDCTHSKL